ncbi:hypothetical protein PV773_24875 [Mesorhizobium sp. CC13]|uniref:hypothetical protein n=1 Tax=Mesorhizobium sp. CC13 TaxID=3029194 RepID=UPI0032640929
MTTTPAEIMGPEAKGCIAEGQPTDLVLFERQRLARAESNRIVIRDSAPLATSLPSYAELDGLGRFPID